MLRAQVFVLQLRHLLFRLPEDREQFRRGIRLRRCAVDLRAFCDRRFEL